MIRKDIYLFPQVIKNFFKIKSKYQNVILAYRIGDFYEFIDEDSINISSKLSIAITYRKYKNAPPIAISGFPYHALPKYLPKILESGESIALCEQFQTYKNNKKFIYRKVVKVITPGTILDKNLLSPNVNLVGAVFEKNNKYGYVILDVTTGNFTGYIIKDIKSLKTQVNLTNPMEILYSKNFINIDNILNKSILKHERPTYEFLYDFAKKQLNKQFQTFSVDCFGGKEAHLAIQPAGCLLNYIKLNFKIKNFQHIKYLKIIYHTENIHIDNNTVKNLQLIEDSNDKPSLFKFLDKTSTYMGSRKLKKWLLNPIRDLNIIKDRQKSIAYLLKNKLFLEGKKYLKKTPDLERILARLSIRLTDPKDLVNLIKIFKNLPEIKSILKKSKITHLLKLNKQIKTFKSLYKTLIKAIAIEPSFRIQDGGVIATGYSKYLDKLRKLAMPEDDLIKNWELREIKNLGIRSLKIMKNNIHGYFIQIKKSISSKIIMPQHYIKIQTLKHCERYITLELKEYENKNKEAQLLANSYESLIYYNVVSIVYKELDKLINMSKAISEIDVLNALAEISYENNYVCPKITKKKIFKYVAGRHPLVTNCISNDLLLNDQTNTLLITGPNMAGKSTFMKQTAIIVILSYMGCYVPAESVIIGPIDRIFTRMGVYDDLASGKSSFMVEMSETANILNNATEDSLVLIDEIGRGTNIKEGQSIALSCIKHLAKINSFNLISTHYNKITKISNVNSKIKNVHFSIIKKINKIIFLYNLIEGPSTQIGGISIAKKAGISKNILK